MVMRPTIHTMLISEVLESAGSQLAQTICSDPATTISGITHDSRAVMPGDIYVAVPGFTRHGIEFVEQAKAAGAVAVASDAHGCEIARAHGLATIELQDVRAEMAHLAAAVYGHPERALKLVGVTGTNGKTTITHMMRAIGTSSNRSTAVIGTVGVYINGEVLPQSRTTPESTDLYALLAVMRERGVEIVLMEVSSHAIVLHRVDGLIFNVVLFTNLTQDHLDFHSTMDEYFAAKAQIFTKRFAQRAIVCVDDEWGMKLAAISDIPVTTVGVDGEWKVSLASQSTAEGTVFTATSRNGGEVEAAVNMLGSFNAVNAMMAALAWEQLGLSLSDAVGSLKDLPQIPGRLELVDCGQKFTAVVDYAHTPDAVQKVLSELRRVCSGHLIVVLGCGGDRDANKRPLMGEAAATLADVVIVTDDNPRSEDPSLIRAAVLSGTRSHSAAVSEVGDRAAAISSAVAAAGTGDVVAVLGKGHESGQEIAGVVHPFNDREVLCEVLKHA